MHGDWEEDWRKGTPNRRTARNRGRIENGLGRKIGGRKKGTTEQENIGACDPQTEAAFAMSASEEGFYLEHHVAGTRCGVREVA
jgi:hypothetical protein